MSDFPFNAAGALHLAALIASVGFSISVLEDLAQYRHFRDDGILSWQVARLRQRWTSVTRLAPLFDFLFAPSRYRFVLTVAFVAGLSMPVTLLYPALLGPLVFLLLVMMYLVNVRNPYGLDGADQMSLLVFGAVFVGTLVPDGSLGQYACVAFIAAQAVLSYTIAGLAKLVSPVWRSGQALIGIFSTNSYGHSGLHALLRNHPRLSWVMCWVVIVFESAFAVIFFVPLPAAVSILALAALFHASNAVLMGLNDFLWAFVSTYPVVLFCLLSWL